jgi:hypothetical protein
VPNLKADHKSGLRNHTVPSLRAGALKLGTRPCPVPFLGTSLMFGPRNSRSLFGIVLHQIKRQTTIVV